MANPYLADDESVVLATENIRVRTIQYQALILTNKRVLLIRMDGDRISAEEFLISDLRSALVSQAAKEPTLLLSYVTPRGEARRESIVFVPTPQKIRRDEVREWAKKLSDQLQPLPDEEIPLTPSSAPAKTPPPAAGVKGGTTPEILAKHERPAGFSFPDVSISDEPEKPPFPVKTIGIAVLAVIVIAALAWVFLVPHAPPMEGTAAPTITPAETPPQVTPEETTAQPAIETLPPTPAPVQFKIPETGVWVHVVYARNFSGTLAGDATSKEVIDSGEHWYPMSATKGSVRAIIGKTDASGETLTVDIFRNGKLLTGWPSNETANPLGEVNLQIDLTTPTPTPTPSPTS